MRKSENTDLGRLDDQYLKHKPLARKQFPQMRSKTEQSKPMFQRKVNMKVKVNPKVEVKTFFINARKLSEPLNIVPRSNKWYHAEE